MDSARLAAAAVCVGGVLAGCGTERPGVTEPASTILADQLLERSASATAAAGTARLLLTARLDLTSSGANVTQMTSSDGVVDFRADSSDVRKHQPYGGASEIRRIGTASYKHQQQPPGLSHLGPDKAWLRSDLPAQERQRLATTRAASRARALGSRSASTQPAPGQDKGRCTQRHGSSSTR